MTAIPQLISVDFAVLEHVYELLGLISFKYPTALVEAQAVCMRNMFLLTLESAALAQNHVRTHALLERS